MGDPGYSRPPDHDQRGAPFLRLVDGNGDSTPRIDIGAIEHQVLPVAIWEGDSANGNDGDGVSWTDPNNWTVNGVPDQVPPPNANIAFKTAPTVGLINHEVLPPINSITFEDGYALSGDLLTINSGEIIVEPAVTATIVSTIDSDSSAGVNKRGLGTLVITGAVMDDFVVETGTLEVTSTASINSLTINGGTAIVAGTVNGNLTNNGGTLVPAAPGDFNLNGQLNGADIDALFARLPGTVPAVHARFDLVPDGVIDGLDVERLIHDVMQREFGDADLDGDIDITDFNTLAIRFDPLGVNQHNGWGQGNFDGDADVDISDFNRIVRNFSPTGYALLHTHSTSIAFALSQNRRTAQPLDASDDRYHASVEIDVDERAGSQATVEGGTQVTDDFGLDLGRQRRHKKLPAKMVVDLALAEFGHPDPN